MLNRLQGKHILVTGVTGQVGSALVQLLKNCCQLSTAARHGADFDLDLADTEQIKAVIATVRPDIVINAAAYTQVDQAEDEPETARVINAVAPKVLAEQCKNIGALLIHYSTDYVFAGTGDQPLNEDDPVSPINVYGQTKLDGEKAIQSVDCDHLIFRTCWVYDVDGKNFLNTMINLARSRQELQVVADQFGTPTSAAFIADLTVNILEKDCLNERVSSQNTNRIYNLTATGFTTWFGFANSIFDRVRQSEQLKLKNVTPVCTDKFPTKARRPKWSVLNTHKIARDFDLELPRWEDLVAQCIDKKFADS